MGEYANIYATYKLLASTMAPGVLYTNARVNDNAYAENDNSDNDVAWLAELAIGKINQKLNYHFSWITSLKMSLLTPLAYFCDAYLLRLMKMLLERK